MSAIFSIFAVPFGHVMRYIYQFVGSYGLSIILFSLLAKLLMMPVSLKQKRSMMKTQAIQPKIQALQKQYGKDQQRLNQELQDLYAREDVSPMGGCGTALITMPIMLGLYYVISTPLTYFMMLSTDQIAQMASLLGVELSAANGGQVALAGLIKDNFSMLVSHFPSLLNVDYNFLGLNLAATPDFKSFGLLWIIPLLSGLTAYLMSFITQKLAAKANPQPQEGAMASQAKMMALMMPAMSLVFGFMLPAGLGLYWIANNIFTAVQEVILQKFILSKDEKPGEK
jgi:membrane protein insertase, YidC/Oxa1 family, C-terminal domain